MSENYNKTAYLWMYMKEETFLDGIKTDLSLPAKKTQ